VHRVVAEVVADVARVSSSAAGGIAEEDVCIAAAAGKQGHGHISASIAHYELWCVRCGDVCMTATHFESAVPIDVEDAILSIDGGRFEARTSFALYY
jgi:hypothetical protein